MEIIDLLIGVVAGAAVCFLFVRILRKKPEGVPPEIHNSVVTAEAVARQSVQGLTVENENLNTQLGQARQEIIGQAKDLSALNAVHPRVVAERDELVEKCDSLQGLCESYGNQIANLNTKLSVALREKTLLEERIELEAQLAEKHDERSRTSFENLANKIFDEKARTFGQQVEKDVKNLLHPLKEKIGSFEKKVEDESKERHSLKNEIVKLVEATDRTTQEANSLASAIRGDSKVQGDWGEHLVEMILESAGLVEGRDFFAQASQETHDGQRVRPDFLVNLPQHKHLIVDSKVSLVAYEAYRSAQDDGSRQEALAAHLKSIRSHIDDLADKHYHKAKNVNAPDWVFMFVAVEPAYILAMQMDPSLFAYAQKKGVVMVTASTLLASLRTVAYIWKLEKQQRNAQAIAQEAGRLYDKFVGFLEDFEKVGKVFISGQTLYENAWSKLKSGPGNVIRKLEQIRDLGAAPAKRIKQEIVDTADPVEVSLIPESMVMEAAESRAP